MTQPERSSTRTGWYLLAGFVLVVLGILLPFSGAAGSTELILSLAMLVAGAVLLLIGGVATGVRMGTRNRNAGLESIPTDESP